MRLAFRVEGTRWVAYVAQLGTMARAVEIGSVTMMAVDQDPELKQRFMDLMKDTMGHMLKAVTGASEIEWPNQPVPAPESERSGTA